MLKSISVFLLLVLCIPCKAQDTTRTRTPGDTLIIYRDSLHIFNDTLSTRDSTGLLTTAKNLAKIDSLVPLFTRPLSGNSYIISNKEIQFFNYRNTEDMLQLYNFYYFFNHGSLGYPTNNYLQGTNNIGYYQNGLNLSNLTNYFNLNLIQSEDIDSVEIIPAPRASLFSYDNVSSAVNFITREEDRIRPYTRIKYYQGASGEAMFDGIFNSILYKRLFGYLDISNSKFDRSYSNTGFNSWQVMAKLKYLLSNDFNIIASYNYAKLYKGLNGGINIDSTGVSNIGLIFNDFIAPVNFYLQDLNEKMNSYNIRILTKPIANLSADATFYYRNYYYDFNNYEDMSGAKLYQKNQDKGILLNGMYSSKRYFDLHFNAQYGYKNIIDGNSFNSYEDSRGTAQRTFNISSILSFPLLEFIRPSVFYSHGNINYHLIYPYRVNLPGEFDTYSTQDCIGADFTLTPFNNFSLYGGYARLQNYSLSSPNITQISASYQMGNLNIRGEFINRSFNERNVASFSGSLHFRLGSFTLESNNIYDQNVLYNFREGVYFLDSLFKPNLLLKAGVFINIIGPRSGTYSRYSKDTGIISRTSYNWPADYSLGITLAGEIRKAATIYFTWENILDRKYFIVPFYPIRGSNVRFGVAWELLN